MSIFVTESAEKSINSELLGKVNRRFRKERQLDLRSSLLGLHCQHSGSVMDPQLVNFQSRPGMKCGGAIWNSVSNLTVSLRFYHLRSSGLAGRRGVTQGKVLPGPKDQRFKGANLNSHAKPASVMCSLNTNCWNDHVFLRFRH